jgi:hypothetical protein
MLQLNYAPQGELLLEGVKPNVVSVIAGTTTIERSSKDSSVASIDKTSYRTMLDNVEKGLKGEPYYYDEVNAQIASLCALGMRLESGVINVIIDTPSGFTTFAYTDVL